MNVFQKDKLFTGAVLAPVAFLMGGPGGVLSLAAFTALSIKIEDLEQKERAERSKKWKYTPPTKEELEEERINWELAREKINAIRNDESTIMFGDGYGNCYEFRCGIPMAYKYKGNHSEVVYQISKDSEEIRKDIFLFNDPTDFIHQLEWYIKRYGAVQCYRPKYDSSRRTLWLMFKPISDKPYGDYYIGYIR